MLSTLLLLWDMRGPRIFLLHIREQNPSVALSPVQESPLSIAEHTWESVSPQGQDAPAGPSLLSRAWSPLHGAHCRSSLYLFQCSFQTWSLPAYQCDISLVYLRVPCGSWGGCGSQVHACGRQRSTSISLWLFMKQGLSLHQKLTN